MANLRDVYNDFYGEKEPIAKSKLDIFKLTFPEKDFKHLKIQRDDISTDDGCTHFYHILEKKVYSYDDYFDKWFISTSPLEDKIKLFDFKI